jgi:hypothetical protein
MTEQEIKYEGSKMLLKMLEKEKEKINEKLNNNSQNEDVLNYVLKCLKNLTFSLQDDIYLYEHPDADAINSLDEAIDEAYSIIENAEE